MLPEVFSIECTICGQIEDIEAQSGGYTQGVNAINGRPEFTCTACGNSWTYGDSGSEWRLR